MSNQGVIGKTKYEVGLFIGAIFGAISCSFIMRELNQLVKDSTTVDSDSILLCFYISVALLSVFFFQALNRGEQGLRQTTNRREDVEDHTENGKVISSITQISCGLFQGCYVIDFIKGKPLHPFVIALPIFMVVLDQTSFRNSKSSIGRSFCGVLLGSLLVILYDRVKNNMAMYQAERYEGADDVSVYQIVFDYSLTITGSVDFTLSWFLFKAIKHFSGYYEVLDDLGPIENCPN